MGSFSWLVVFGRAKTSFGGIAQRIINIFRFCIWMILFRREGSTRDRLREAYGGANVRGKVALYREPSVGSGPRRTRVRNDRHRRLGLFKVVILVPF